MKRKITLFFSLPFFVGGLLAQPMTPAQHMAMSAQATAAAQQHAQQQALYGQINHNLMTCGREYCGGTTSNQSPRPQDIPAPVFAGLREQYGGIAVEYVDDILRDNYGNPVPFSWEGWRRHTSAIDGKRLEDLSVFDRGVPWPMELHFAGNFRQELPTPEWIELKLREECRTNACQPFLLYKNTCPAIAVGWLKNYDGLRIYASTNATAADHVYQWGDSTSRHVAYPMMEKSREEALRRCQSDPAVNAASCEAVEDQTDLCALPAQIMR